MAIQDYLSFLNWKSKKEPDKDPETKSVKKPLLKSLDPSEEEMKPFDYNPYDDNDILKKISAVKKFKEKEVKKVKISDLERHPFFKYITDETLELLQKSNDEIPEDNVVYDIEELPIKQGDYVNCEEFDDLNENQLEFLKMKPYYKVRSIVNKNGRYYQSGEPHIDLGYRIPFKMKRFKKFDRNTEGKYKILFLQFDLAIDTHGEKDEHNYFRGTTKMADLFEILFKEKLPDSFVDFCPYDDIYKVGNDFYIDDMKIKDYDFVFFGFMSNFTTMVKMLISYLDKYKIPYLKYGTYKDFDNKAYEMHLLQSLGYPYIPSIMASKITSKVAQSVKEFGFPVIVKDINLNRGEGVWKIDSMKGLLETFSSGNKLMLIQKHIPNDGDFRVISIKNKVELVIKKERIKGSKEFRANVARGGKAVKGILPKEIIDMCEDISNHLVCDIVGFDIIQNKVTKEYYVMETNSSPHFPTFSVISEIDIPGIITDYIIRKIKK